jgi:hypothetical protein
MTTIVRRKRVSRSEIGPYRRHELLTGQAIYPVRGYTGYGDGHDPDMEHFISGEMRWDWLENRTELLAFWRSGKDTCEVFSDCRVWLSVSGSPGTLPWAARMFDKDDEPEPKRQPQKVVHAGQSSAPEPRPTP